MTKMNVIAPSLLLVTLLTACGGANGPAPVATVSGTDVPVAATTSAAAVVSFAQEQITKTSESTEPLKLGDAVLAVDDTAEPAPV